MTNPKINNLLIPNVTRAKPKGQVENQKHLESSDPNEFKSLLQEKIQAQSPDQGIRLSIHASKRLEQRNMKIDAPELKKIKEGIEKLEQKGGQDSLLITSLGAYIVDVPNRTVVTAVDKESLQESVFTKIDSTIVLS